MKSRGLNRKRALTGAPGLKLEEFTIRFYELVNFEDKLSEARFT
jgi:hypothetical protein